MALHIWTGASADGNYSTAGNWSGGVPVAAGDVLIQGSVSITAGLNQSAVAIDKFEVAPGYSGTIGSVTAPLQIDPDGFDFTSTGLAYIDIGSAAISPVVRGTATAATAGTAGLYLKGSAIATLSVLKGTVAVALLTDETATITTANCLFTTTQATDAGLILGPGVTLTTLNQTGGSVDLRCALTTINATGGTLNTRGSGAITTMNADGATIYPQSTGTITTLNANAGTIDFRRSLTARTVTTLASTGQGAVIYLGDYITLTNQINPAGNVKITIAQG